MTTNTKFAEMLCTRFCHDIIGPVGAVSNGAEFLRDEMPNVQSQALDLIEKSSKEAIARVQFYRQSYGIGLKDSSASLTDTRNIAANYFAAGKIELDWQDKYTDQSGVEVNQVQKKLILNLLIICASALIRGGKIIFYIDNSKIEIKAEGAMVKVDPEIISVLNSSTNTENPDAKLVQVYYTKILAQEANSDLETTKSDTNLTFMVTKR